MKNPSVRVGGCPPLGHLLTARAGVAIVVMLLLWLGGPPAVTAQGNKQHEHQRPAASTRGATEGPPAVSPPAAGREIVFRGRKIILPDVSLVDQDGRKVRLYEDLIKGKTIALGFFYTRCTLICTRHGDLFSRLQTELGSRLGKDVFLISLNMDPVFDTRERIAEWGRSYGRRPGWTLLTGELDEVGKALIALTADAPGPRESHGNFFYVANDQTGRWEAMFVQMPAREVAKKLDQLVSSAQ